MPLILSIETSTPACSVALHKDGKLLACYNIFSEKAHSGLITVLIEKIISHTNYKLNDIDAVAVSKGPGSYTGLRIGVATAKGLCFALDKPLIAINTLEAMATYIHNHQIKNDFLLCPMLDARRMEVYCAIFDANLKIIIPTKAEIIDENSFKDLLRDNKIIFFGSGANKSFEILKFNPNAQLIKDVYPSSVSIGSLAEEAFKNNNFENLTYFEPFYLKDFVSNIKGV